MYLERMYPFPPARHFDKWVSDREPDFTDNPAIPGDIQALVSFLSSRQNWCLDVGRTNVILTEQTDEADHGAVVRLSYYKKEDGRISLDLIPRRTETMDFARRTIEEPVPGEVRMYKVNRAAFGSDYNFYITFETTSDLPKSQLGTTVTLELESGRVFTEKYYDPARR